MTFNPPTWEQQFVQARGEHPDRITVEVRIWATFDTFISFGDALELGEDGGENAGIKKAWDEFVKDERGILQALQSADKIEAEWEVEPR